MSQSATIARLRREVDADPRSMRFVPLAEALRRGGYLGEAEAVLERGLGFHPGLNSARLVQARLYADTGRRETALAVLDELYPRDSGNVALVVLYLELLAGARRTDEARVLLDRAELIGVPAHIRDEFAERLDEALWTDERPGLADETWPPPTIPDASLATAESPKLDVRWDARRDPFATAVVARRLERGGRLEAALRIWQDLAAESPDRSDIATVVYDLQFRIDSGAETLQGGLLQPVAHAPAPRPEAAALLRAWRAAIRAERS